MNSPPEPGSPASVSTESDTPPFLEENQSISAPFDAQSSSFLGSLHSAFNRPGGSSLDAGGSMKRRLAGSIGSHTSARDAKSRRREEGPGARRSGGVQWMDREGHGHGPNMRGSKDDLVDSQLVEQLRAQFGDPFDDDIFKNAS